MVQAIRTVKVQTCGPTIRTEAGAYRGHVPWDDRLNIPENHRAAMRTAVYYKDWGDPNEWVGGQLPDGSYAWVRMPKVPVGDVRAVCTNNFGQPAPTPPVPSPLTVCTDCAAIIAYDDWSVLDGSYPRDVADLREAQIRAGLTQHGEMIVDMSNPRSEGDIRCECCGRRQSGAFWQATPAKWKVPV